MAHLEVSENLGGFTKLGVPFWASLYIMRTIVFWGLHWGPLIWGNYLLRVKGLGNCTCNPSINPLSYDWVISTTVNGVQLP